MKSKISFFNKGVFKNLLQRYWPAWALYSAFWIIVMPVTFLIRGRYSQNPTAVFVSQINALCGGTSVVMAFIAAIIVAMGVFSYMYKSRETSMICSLPVRREAVFGSTFLAGFLPVLVINAAAGLLALLTVIGNVNSQCVHVVLVWYASFALEFITFFGIACFAAMLTGSLVALPILYGFINFFAVAAEGLITGLICSFTYGVSDTVEMKTKVLSPVLYLFDKCRVEYSDVTQYEGLARNISPDAVLTGWPTIIAYAIVGIVFTVFALMLYRCRRMENAGDVIAIEKLCPVFKYIVGLFGALGFGLLMYFGFLGGRVSWNAGDMTVVIVILFMAIGGLIGYFGADMLVKKSVHVFKNNWLGYIIVTAVCAVLCICCRYDTFGIGSYVPDTNEIACVSVSGRYDEISFEDAELIEKVTDIHSDICSNLKEIANESGKYDYESGYLEEYLYINLEYKMKDGKYICRSYEIREDRPEAKKFAEFMCSEAVLKARHAHFSKYTVNDIENAYVEYSLESQNYYSFELTAAQAMDLYKNAIEPDINEGHLNYWDRGRAVERLASETEISITFSTDTDGGETQDCLLATIEPESVYTIQWFKDNFDVDITKPINSIIVNEELGEPVG